MKKSSFVLRALGSGMLCLSGAIAQAGTIVPPAVVNVPALSEWSLFALVPLIGVIAYRSTRKTDRRKDKKDQHGHDDAAQ